jgi:hypothetical protein
MRKRYVVLALSAVLALAVVVPAIGQSSDPTATTSISHKKLKKLAKKGIRLANQALEENDAQDTAIAAAQTTADQALAQGGGGAPGAPGTPGAPGAPGTPGTAGVSTNFLASIDDYGDPDVTFTTQHGFRWFLECEGTTSSVRVENENGGDDSGITSENGVADPDFEEDEIFTVATQVGGDDLEASEQVLIYGTNGNTTQAGLAGVFDDPSTGFGGDDCAGSLNLLAL